MPQVDMFIADELVDRLPELLELLHVSQAKVLDRAFGEDATRVRLDMSYVPEGATLVTPILQRTPHGVRVQSLGWTYAD